MPGLPFFSGFALRFWLLHFFGTTFRHFIQHTEAYIYTGPPVCIALTIRLRIIPDNNFVNYLY